MCLARWFAIVAVVAVCLGSAVSANAAFSDAIVFGDSLTDTGNAYSISLGAIPQSPPHYQGRFSNGPVWVEYLASGLGLPAPTPSRAGGNNYALGGATTPGVVGQISTYLAAHSPTADELFVVWVGGNDLLNNNAIDVSVPVASLASSITTLANAGAEEFLVPNLPPLGQTPSRHGSSNETLMDNLSIAFNTQLETALATLETNLSITIHRLDVFGNMQRLLADPLAHGFTNVTNRAYSGGVVVPNPDEYLFWDGIHPTGAAHAWLGDLAVLAVLEPTLGDANLDGIVNDADATALAAHWHQQSEANWSDGDFNLDGKVTDADASILAAHWSAASESADATVPEPSAGILLATALVLFGLRCARRASPEQT
jgi:thermolabile hemolysin